MNFLIIFLDNTKIAAKNIAQVFWCYPQATADGIPPQWKENSFTLNPFIPEKFVEKSKGNPFPTIISQIANFVKVTLVDHNSKAPIDLFQTTKEEFKNSKVSFPSLIFVSSESKLLDLRFDLFNGNDILLDTIFSGPFSLVSRPVDICLMK